MVTYWLRIYDLDSRLPNERDFKNSTEEFSTGFGPEFLPFPISISLPSLLIRAVLTNPGTVVTVDTVWSKLTEATWWWCVHQIETKSKKHSAIPTQHHNLKHTHISFLLLRIHISILITRHLQKECVLDCAYRQHVRRSRSRRL